MRQRELQVFRQESRRLGELKDKLVIVLRPDGGDVGKRRENRAIRWARDRRTQDLGGQGRGQRRSVVKRDSRAKVDVELSPVSPPPPAFCELWKWPTVGAQLREAFDAQCGGELPKPKFGPFDNAFGKADCQLVTRSGSRGRLRRAAGDKHSAQKKNAAPEPGAAFFDVSLDLWSRATAP